MHSLRKPGSAIFIGNFIGNVIGSFQNKPISPYELSYELSYEIVILPMGNFIGKLHLQAFVIPSRSGTQQLLCPITLCALKMILHCYFRQR